VLSVDYNLNSLPKGICSRVHEIPKKLQTHFDNMGPTTHMPIEKLINKKVNAIGACVNIF
jgi:hypothetical protein